MPPVLLVDDDAVVRELTADALRSEGIDVVESADGQEAVDQMAVLVPSLVVLDLDMPRMNGHDVYAWMQKTGRAGVPVLFASGNLRDLPENLPRLQKPFTLESLLEAVAAHRKA